MGKRPVERLRIDTKVRDLGAVGPTHVLKGSLSISALIRTVKALLQASLLAGARAA